MYKINNGLFPSVLNELYKKNNVIHDHNTRTKGCTVKRAQEKGHRKRAQEKRHGKNGTGKIGTGNKGTSEKLGKRHKGKQLF